MRAEYDEEQRAILDEISQQWSWGKMLKDKGVEVVSFKSRSKGRGRKKGEAKKVTLVKYGEEVHEFDEKKFPPYVGFDSQATEIFEDENAEEVLLEIIEDVMRNSE